MGSSPTKTHYTATELAGLPGLPTTERRVRSMAKRENWPSQKRTGRGGGREYHVSALPQETRSYLLKQSLNDSPPSGDPLQAKPVSEPFGNSEKLPAVLPANELSTSVIDVPDLGNLKTWQTRTMDARLAFIRMLEHAEPIVGITAAIAALEHQIKNHKLPEDKQHLVQQANARSGSGSSKQTISKRTLMRWWSDYKKSGGNYAVLAPASVEKDATPVWAAAFLAQYQVPQKVSVAQAIEHMTLLANVGDGDAPIPSEAQARRFLKKYSRLDIQRGRKSGSELRGQRLYRERSTDEFCPMDITSCDGHSFKAYIAHPSHGRPFHPEVCTVIDVVTRCVIGWSAGLAESSFTVADALRHACTVSEDNPLGGLPLVFYTDNGAGNKAKVNSDEIAGLYSRTGIQFETGFAGNPQGRGIIERLNASLWIPAAKKLATYTGDDMDSLIQRHVYLQLQKDVRAMEKSGIPIPAARLMRWPDFLDFMADEIAAYNNRPHSGLPRVTDPHSGLRRYASPLEVWNAWRARGWQADQLTAAEIGHLFRPHEMVKCVRGRLTLWKNVYSDAALEHYHGMMLMVGYDIHDPSRVSVRDEAGRLIVIAKRDAHKSPFFPVSKIENIREKRFKTRIKNVERRREEIELERRGAPIEARIVPDHIEISAEVIETSDRLIELASKRRLVSSPWERYEDICERAADDSASPYELRWMADYNQFTETGKKTGLIKIDEFCLGEEKEKQKGGATDVL